SPPVHANCCGLSACRNRGALGVPSRIANPPFLSRSSEKVPSSPQCTQSRVPSAVRSTSAGTAPVARLMAPWWGALVAGRRGRGGAGDGDELDGDGVGLSSGMSRGLAEGSVAPPSAAVGGGSGSGDSPPLPCIALLATKPKPTTTRTPARMTE